MENIYLNKKFTIVKIDDSNLTYIIVKNVEQFLHDCDTYSIIEDGVKNEGVYMFNSDTEVWDMVSKKLEEKILSNVCSQYPDFCTTNEVNNNIKNTEKKWNWSIMLGGETVIQMNDEPINLNEIIENFETIQKPSFFGNRIKEIIITRV